MLDELKMLVEWLVPVVAAVVCPNENVGGRTAVLKLNVVRPEELFSEPGALGDF